MTKTVLAFSGGIGSGKSSLSELVSRELGCPRVSFGSVVRERAKEAGLSQDRASLQALGEQMVATDPRDFCTKVLRSAPVWRPGTTLVVDGVRHAGVMGMLGDLVAPSTLRLVFVKVASDVRISRLQSRGEAVTSVDELDRHSTEVEVHEALEKLADLVVDGNRPLGAVLSEVAAWAVSLD